MEESSSSPPLMVRHLRLCAGNGLQGWGRETQRLWPTLVRTTPDEAWGFSAMVGGELGESTALWAGVAGVAARRNDKGIYVKIASVRSGSPADEAGIKSNDFVSRINGQIVFHLSLKDVERLIRDSGCSLLLDIERDSARSLMLGGVYASPLNFLYNEHKPTYLSCVARR